MTNLLDREPGPAISQEEIDAHQLDIKAAWQKAVTSIIATGELLQKKKNEIPYGQFGRLFQGPHKLFSHRTAGMLMAVADHEVISDSKHASNLPASWYSLYLLSKISPERLKVLIEAGTVHAGLQRDDVYAILRREASRERRAVRAELGSYLDNPPEPPKLPSIRDSFVPTTKKIVPSVDDTLRQLRRLLIDLKDAQDAIRRSSSDMKSFRAIADAILGICDGDPVPMMPDEEEVEVAKSPIEIKERSKTSAPSPCVP